MSEARARSAIDTVTDIEDLGVLVSKVNIHVFKFEVANRESSLYVKRTNPEPNHVIVHPNWKQRLAAAAISGIKVATFHDGFLKNSNFSHFPKEDADSSPHGLAVAYENKVSLRHLLNLIGRQTAFNDEDGVEFDNADPPIPDVGSTERDAVIRARRGQGIYRTKLLKKWNGTCSVTGLEFPSILRASHVKPWKASTNAERLDEENGLLLIPNLDAAFDTGLITFSSRGTIVISAGMAHDQLKALGISKTMQISHVSDALKSYLRYHSENVFERFLARS